MASTPMTSSTGNDTKDCYGQLRDLLGNSQENSTSFKKDTAAGFIVGAGSAAREAVPALDKLGLNPIFILHYDSGEMWAGRIIKRQGLRTPAMAQRELDDLKEKGTQVILGVSTIASTPPATPREEYVYNISKLLLEQSYTHTRGQGEHFTLPDKRCLADMLNESNSLYMAIEARKCGWEVHRLVSQHKGTTDTLAEQESPYWWQLKKKAEVS